jgi:succinate dehydrogenase hydrophobic anchor subunit
MRPWLRIVLWSLAFWAVWLGVAGLAMTIHGDCGVSATDAEITACVHEKGWLGVAALAIGAIIYGLLIWRLARRYRRADS